MKASQLGPTHFGVFEFNPHAGELRKQGLKIKLGPQACKVLGLLLENPGQLRTREELQQRLWPGNTFVDFDHSLNKAIHALRGAMGDSATSPRFIETVVGQGYRFIPILQEITVAVNKRWSKQRIESVAVLPLACEIGEPDMPFLAARIVSGLINTLSRIPSVRVLAYNIVKHYKSDGDAQAIGRELGVQGVVAAEIIRRNGDAIIYIELIDVANGAQVWGAQLKHSWAELMTCADHITSEVSRRLRSILDAHGTASRKPVHQPALKAAKRPRPASTPNTASDALSGKRREVA